MEYTEIIYLVKKIDSSDLVGNLISEESFTKCYAKEKVVGTKEFYNAVSVGITPTAELKIKRLNYSNEEELIWNDKRYSIVRTLPIGNMDMILVLSEKQGVFNEQKNS